jgi:RIO kinase 1
MHDVEYRDGRKFAKSRDRRAVERMTSYGRSLRRARWTGHELEVLERAWDAGVNVPYPVGSRGDGMLMQYLGGDEGAAPRLAEARLERVALQDALDQLVANLHLLVRAGYVHADLSAYNVLWWEGQVWLIDFPQAVDLTANPRAIDFLHRDVTNVTTWFGRRGVDLDGDELFADLLAEARGP